MIKKVKYMITILFIALLVILSEKIEAKAYYNLNETYKYGHFVYAYDTETGYIWIVDYTGNEEIVVVPSEIHGVTVRYIGGFGKVTESYLKEKKESVKKIQLPEGIEIICGLGYCVNLQEINIPESVKEIGDEAFYFCEELRYISLPKGLERIGVDAFQSCGNLQITEWSTSLKVIEEGAFGECGNLKYVKLPKGLKKIGEGAFHNCTSLEEMIIPDTVTEIGAEAFEYCTSLSNIKLSKNLKVIKDSVFEGCSRIKSIKIPRKVKRIEKDAFSGTAISKVTIPSKVTYIGEYAFAACKKLKKITIRGTKLKAIKKKAFVNIHPKAVFDVPNKYISKYKKILINSKNFKQGKMKIK